MISTSLKGLFKQYYSAYEITQGVELLHKYKLNNFFKLKCANNNERIKITDQKFF